MTQEPVTIDISRKRGDTFPFTFTVTDATGTAIDITGFTYSLAVDPDSAPANGDGNLFSLVGTVTDGPNGKVQFSLSVGQSDFVGRYYYDLQQVDTSSFIRTIAKGDWHFVQDISKG